MRLNEGFTALHIIKHRRQKHDAFIFAVQRLRSVHGPARYKHALTRHKGEFIAVKA